MLFRKKITRSCSYCQHGASVGEEQILCVKRGIVSTNDSCRKFRYNPFKRIPPRVKALNFQKFDETDFSL